MLPRRTALEKEGRLGEAMNTAGEFLQWKRELAPVTTEKKTPGEPGAFTANWSGKRDLKFA